MAKRLRLPGLRVCCPTSWRITFIPSISCGKPASGTQFRESSRTRSGTVASRAGGTPLGTNFTNCWMKLLNSESGSWAGLFGVSGGSVVREGGGSPDCIGINFRASTFGNTTPYYSSIVLTSFFISSKDRVFPALTSALAFSMSSRNSG